MDDTSTTGTSTGDSAGAGTSTGAGDRAELVHLDIADEVATITLDSPANRNALSSQLTWELLTALAVAEADSTVKVVVLAAAGPVFCSGADLSEAVSADLSEGPRTIVALQRAILALDKPVVARVQGAVRAGGIGLVAAADIALAATAATFALTEVRLGLAAAAISLTVLPRMSSRAGAQALLTGSTFDAVEAARTGLVTTAADDLDGELARVVTDLRKGAPQGLREAKRLLNRDLIADLDARGEEVAQLSARLFASDEARAAMLAFLNRTR
jgi:enoyl-CoA hydratase/carnithine racemase